MIKNIDLSSIRAFPGFLMNWFQDQIDEVVSSLGDLPDMRVVLPELSGITDPGWIKSL